MPEPPLLRTSERKDFKRCPWLWHVTWHKRMVSKRVPTWAWFGTAIHKGLEAYYKPGRKRGSMKVMLEAFEASLEGEVRRIYLDGGQLDEQERVDGLELGREMLIGYVQHYGKDTEWEVLQPEMAFQIDVPHPTKKGRTLVVYAGQIDAVMRNLRTGEIWLWDHKTRKAFLSQWSYLELDDQPGSYLWVAREVLLHKELIDEDETIEGIIFNFLRKALPDQRETNDAGEALNRDGSVSKRQPAPRYHREEVYRNVHELVSLAHRVQDEAVVMDKVRRGKLPIFKTPMEDCSRCKIFDYCCLHESDPEAAAEFAKETMMKRDPYADHREDMERGGLAL